MNIREFNNIIPKINQIILKNTNNKCKPKNSSLSKDIQQHVFDQQQEKFLLHSQPVYNEFELKQIRRKFEIDKQKYEFPQNYEEYTDEVKHVEPISDYAYEQLHKQKLYKELRNNQRKSLILELHKEIQRRTNPFYEKSQRRPSFSNIIPQPSDQEIQQIQQQEEEYQKLLQEQQEMQRKHEEQQQLELQLKKQKNKCLNKFLSKKTQKQQKNNQNSQQSIVSNLKQQTQKEENPPEPILQDIINLKMKELSLNQIQALIKFLYNLIPRQLQIEVDQKKQEIQNNNNYNNNSNIDLTDQKLQTYKQYKKNSYDYLIESNTKDLIKEDDNLSNIYKSDVQLKRDSQKQSQSDLLELKKLQLQQEYLNSKLKPKTYDLEALEKERIENLEKEKQFLKHQRLQKLFQSDDKFNLSLETQNNLLSDIKKQSSQNLFQKKSSKTDLINFMSVEEFLKHSKLTHQKQLKKLENNGLMYKTQKNKQNNQNLNNKINFGISRQRRSQTEFSQQKTNMIQNIIQDCDAVQNHYKNNFEIIDLIDNKFKNKTETYFDKLETEEQREAKQEQQIIQENEKINQYMKQQIKNGFFKDLFKDKNKGGDFQEMKKQNLIALQKFARNNVNGLSENPLQYNNMIFTIQRDNFKKLQASNKQYYARNQKELSHFINFNDFIGFK